MITIDPTKTFQTMSGWEATAQAGQEDSKAFPSYQNVLLDQVVELGINRVRLESRSGLENPRDWWSDGRGGKISGVQFKDARYQAINDNDDPNVINWSGFQFAHFDFVIDTVVLPLKQRLERRGERLFINVNYVNFGKSGFAQFNDAEEYAEFVLANYLHMKEKYGFVPDAWEVALEPDNTSFSGRKMGEAIVAAARRLRAQGFKPSFIAPSTTKASNAPLYFDEIVSVSGAVEEISEISYHRYCCATSEVLGQIRERAQKYKLKAGMLEFIGADYEMLHQDIKEGWNSSWQQYTVAYPTTNDNGAQYFSIADGNATNPVVKVASRTKFLRQYFKYIRMDAQRLGASTDNSAVDPLAFRNANGGHVVVVKSGAGGRLTVNGLPQGNYGITYTTHKEDFGSLPDIRIGENQPLTVNIPQKGVITVFSR